MKKIEKQTLGKRQFLCKLSGHNFLPRQTERFQKPELGYRIDGRVAIGFGTYEVTIKECEFCKKLKQKEEKLSWYF